MARKGVLRIIAELLHPVAQLRGVNVQVLRCLRIRYASILDQAHSLKLELPREPSSLHDPPPAPSKHLTRCLRNRVQANVRHTLPQEHFVQPLDTIEDRADTNVGAADSAS